jgi:imidazolonepropionase-like amidohydrolase
MIAQTAPRTPAPASRAVIARMADFMLAHAASNGSVDRDALLLEFSEEEIAAHFEPAKAEARRRGKGRH